MSAILVVDDDVQILDVMSEMLRLEGHEVSTAENGEIAVTKLKSLSCDLVITDIIMPQKEGLETIADIRRDYGGLPIIAMSGGGRGDGADYLETARYIGADAVLSKPFARKELISAVSSLLP